MAQPTEPTFYLIMRNDLDSMNWGKSLIQATHAGHAFVGHINKLIKEGTISAATLDAFRKWENSTEQNCGTGLSLAATIQQIEEVDKLSQAAEVVAGIFIDPSYPIRDGAITHYVPLATCSYVFSTCRRSDTIVKGILGGLRLHA